MQNVTKTYLKGLKLEELTNLMEDAGVAFSRDVTKPELEKLAYAQKDQIEEFLNAGEIEDQNEDQNNEEVNEMTENNNNNEAAENVENSNEQAEENVTSEQTEEMVELELNGNTTQVPQSVADRVEEIREGAFEQIADVVGEDAAGEILGQPQNEDAQATQDEQPQEEQPKKRRGGGKAIEVTFFENGQENHYGYFDTIKATAQEFKDAFNLKAMPFNNIMKSTRSNGEEMWNIEGVDYKFIFINKDDVLTPSQYKEKYGEKPQGNASQNKSENAEVVAEAVVQEMSDEEIEALKNLI